MQRILLKGFRKITLLSVAIDKKNRRNELILVSLERFRVEHSSWMSRVVPLRDADHPAVVVPGKGSELVEHNES